VNVGIARAKAGGKHRGRPFIDIKLEGHIRDALAPLVAQVCTRSPSSSASARTRSSALRRRRSIRAGTRCGHQGEDSETVVILADVAAREVEHWRDRAARAEQ
jgi:hypothetical protein